MERRALARPAPHQAVCFLCHTQTETCIRILPEKTRIALCGQHLGETLAYVGLHKDLPENLLWPNTPLRPLP